MKTLVIAEFPAKSGKLGELEATLRVALPDTRAFDGCISIQTYLHPETSTFTLIEDWESPQNYERYLAWRMENGLGELPNELLEGGAEGFRSRKEKTQ